MYANTYVCVYRMRWSAGKEGSTADTNADAPAALEYLPATHEVHVAADDEVAPS